MSAILEPAQSLESMPAKPADPARPIKVLFFYQDFGQMGGIERWLEQTARLLRARGLVEPVAVCSEDSPLYRALVDAGVRVHGLRSHRSFSRSILRGLDLAALWRLRKILLSERPDCVHVHIGLLENAWIRRLGFPVLYSFHGYGTLYSLRDVHNPLKRLFKKMVRRLFLEASRHVDALLFVSAAERNRMLEEGFIEPERSGEVLHNGMDSEAFRMQAASVDRRAAKVSLGIPEASRCVSFINRLDVNKNPLAFIALARTLSRDEAFNDVYFILAGDGPLMTAVKREAADLPNLRVLGHCPDVGSVLAVSDLLIHPARREGFGLGLLEAMAAGVPCLALASGGARELLEQDETERCLVEDESRLAQEAGRMLRMPEAEKQALVDALQARARCFDSDRFVERLEAVYRRLVPRFSVILPVYNGEETVLQAAASVLAQTYPHLELTVVDDGSTDGTLEQLATIRDPRLKVLWQANQGVATARNFGFSHAVGDFIAFIDADDVWLPEKLASEAEVIRRAGAEAQAGCLIYSGYYAVDERARLVNLPGLRHQSGDLSAEVLAEEGIFLPTTASVHRRVFEAIGGFRTDCYHEDRVFFIEACRQFPAYATGKRLALYQQSLSGRCRRVLQDYEQALSAELSIVDSLRPLLSDEALRLLEARQLRNLLFRFLMYGYLSFARRVQDSLAAQPAAPDDLFTGKKGLLARLSLMSGMNFLAMARRLAQVVYGVLGLVVLPRSRKASVSVSADGSVCCPQSAGVVHAGF